MKNTLKAILIVFILVVMNNALAEEKESVDCHEVLWFSTSTSSLLNRSSTELATNHIKRGLRLAHLALQKELLLPDQLIANHNLCVGFLSAGKTIEAKPYCTRATKLSQIPFNIIKIRGANYLSDKTVSINAQSSTDLLQTVLRNIEIHNLQIRLSLLNN